MYDNACKSCRFSYQGIPYICFTSHIMSGCVQTLSCLLDFLSYPSPPSPSGFEENLEVQGELILQDSFQVWDPRSLIRKGRDRHLFLFEFSLVFSKEIKDSAGRTKYQYKNKLLVCVCVCASMHVFYPCFCSQECSSMNSHIFKNIFPLLSRRRQSWV